jgi:hypothetical protein
MHYLALTTATAWTTTVATALSVPTTTTTTTTTTPWWWHEHPATRKGGQQRDHDGRLGQVIQLHENTLCLAIFVSREIGQAKADGVTAIV